MTGISLRETNFNLYYIYMLHIHIYVSAIKISYTLFPLMEAVSRRSPYLILGSFNGTPTREV